MRIGPEGYARCVFDSIWLPPPPTIGTNWHLIAWYFQSWIFVCVFVFVFVFVWNSELCTLRIWLHLTPTSAHNSYQLTSNCSVFSTLSICMCVFVFVLVFWVVRILYLTLFDTHLQNKPTTNWHLIAGHFQPWVFVCVFLFVFAFVYFFYLC